MSWLLATRMRYVAAFTIGYMLVFMAVAWQQSNTEFLFYGGFMVIFISIMGFIDYRVRFSQAVLWGMTLWGFLHLLGGVMPIAESVTEPGKSSVLYNMRLFPWFPKYDQLMHAYGFAMATRVAYESLSAHLGRALPINWSIGSAIFLIAMGLGAINEVIEFTAVMLMSDTNVGGYINTGWDLVCNAIGSLLMVAWLKHSVIKDR